MFTHFAPWNVLYTGNGNNDLLAFPPDIQSCPVISANGMVAVGIASTTATGRIITVNNDGTLGGLDQLGNLLWKSAEPLSQAFSSSDAVIYAVAPITNDLVALDSEHGTVLWRQHFTDPITGQFLGDDGNIYLTAGTNLFVSTTPLALGTISVSTNNAAATFTIAGPVAYSGNGTSFIQTNAPVGTYTISYGPVPGYVAPQIESLILSAGGTIHFIGDYKQVLLSLSSTLINFSYEEGFVGPIAPQQLNIFSSPLQLSFSFTTTTSSGGSWLFANSNMTTTPATMNVSVSNSLPAGTYSGQISVTAPLASNPVQTATVALTVTPKPCLVTSTSINLQDSNGVVTAKFTPGETNCDGILEINNQKLFWTNFRLQLIGQPSVTPLGGDANLYVKFGLLPPKSLLPLPLTSPVAFHVKFSRPGDSIFIFADPTAETGLSAGLMNMVQAILNVIPGSGIAQATIDDFVKINAAFDQMPHLRNAVAALFSKSPDFKTFASEFKNIDLNEATTLVTLIRDLSGSTARELLKLLLKAPFRIVNSLTTIFGEMRAAFFVYPSGSVALQAK